MAIARIGTAQKTKGFSVAGDIVGKSCSSELIRLGIYRGWMGVKVGEHTMFKASPIMKTRSEFVINAGFLIR